MKFNLSYYKNCFVVLGSFLLFGCSPEQNRDGKFVLEGNFMGRGIDTLLLAYQDKDGNGVRDKLIIKEGRFSAKGYLNRGSMAMISDYKVQLTDDPNFAFIFIEPRNMTITLTKDKFKEALVKNSPTQKELEHLSKLEAPIYAQMTPFMKDRDSLIKEFFKTNDPEIKKRLDIIRVKQTKKLDEIKEYRLAFVRKNPNSYLSPYWIDNYYFRSMPMDSVEWYYNSFVPSVKGSLYGKELKLKIDKSKIASTPGNIAPKFTARDLDGKELSLESFKGKYVLLDFWASWCGPCRKGNPALKELYAKYHPKGLEIIGLTSDSLEDKWREAIKNDGIGIWHHVFAGKQGIAINTSYNITAIPGYILIDKNGIIIGRYLAADNQDKNLEDLNRKLDEVL